MGAVVSGSGPGGSIPKGVEELLYSGRPGGPTLWGGDVVPHSEDGEGPGQLSAQGSKEDHWEATAAKERREMGLPTSGGGTEGSGNGGDTDIHNMGAEYGCAIYCDATDSGSMQAGHSAARSAGVSEVVGAGLNRPGGSKETGGGINNEIGDRVGGVFGQVAERGYRRRQEGVSGSKRVKWRGEEDK